MEIFKKPVFYYRGYTQAFFFFALALYVLYFKQSNIFEGTHLDTLVDAISIGSLVIGELLRLWGVSHVGKSTRSRRLKAPTLVITGPYAYIRHPIYVGNFLIGIGIVLLSGAMPFILAFLVLFGIQYSVITSEEEKFLRENFGEGFDQYCRRTPKYIPQSTLRRSRLTFGFHFPLKELGTAWGVIVAGYFFEWIESPLHHAWILNFYHWVTGGLIL